MVAWIQASRSAGKGGRGAPAACRISGHEKVATCGLRGGCADGVLEVRASKGQGALEDRLIDRRHLEHREEVRHGATRWRSGSGTQDKVEQRRNAVSGHPT